MSTKQQAVASRELPVTVDINFDGDWCVYEAGEYVCKCNTESQARQIAHALNSLPGIKRAIEVLESVGRLKRGKRRQDGLYFTCPVCGGENGNHRSICGIGDALAQLAAAEKGMV